MGFHHGIAGINSGKWSCTNHWINCFFSWFNHQSGRYPAKLGSSLAILTWLAIKSQLTMGKYGMWMGDVQQLKSLEVSWLSPGFVANRRCTPTVDYRGWRLTIHQISTRPLFAPVCQLHSIPHAEHNDNQYISVWSNFIQFPHVQRL
jgi:hypothetical protein